MRQCFTGMVSSAAFSRLTWHSDFLRDMNIVILNDNIHCIRARTGLKLKRVKRMWYALNHQVFDRPV